MISKKVGNTTLAPTQKVDYNYNIRGWLTGINDVTALTKAGDPKDLFAFKINYNSTTTTGVNALYNGNISETYWTSANSETILRGYGYAYDNLNRLKTGLFKQNGSINNFYDETLAYDKNGNIMSVFRNGNATSVQQIDNLVYSYGPANSLNQLTKVVDNATTYKAGGFVDSAANTVDDYSYDANGNMTKDNNKNITAIAYNHLNLPVKITFATTGNIVYIYNAAGQKVQKIVNETSKAAITTDYLGGYQYDNALLKFFPTAEGYVEPSGSSYKYVYQYKDHLGNVRLSYDKTLAIKEESNFYPFGLKQEGYNNVKNGVENKYKYNGKELQDELGLNTYDYGARFYDPSTGRWYTVDAMAEKFSEMSPYNYALNNPVIYVDPDGNEVEMCCDGLKGFLIGVSDNLLGRNDRSNFGGTDFNNGARVADVVSVIGGAMLQGKGLADIAAGTAGLEASVTVTAASGGLAVEVSGPAAAISAGKIAVGGIEVTAGSNISSNAMSNLKEGSSNSSSTNGNSKSSTKAQHNYDIEDTHNDNKVVKTGTSGGKETKSGQSYRGNSQANKWNKTEGTPGRYKSTTTNRVSSGQGARTKALDYEKNRATQVRSQLDPAKHSRP